MKIADFILEKLKTKLPALPEKSEEWRKLEWKVFYSVMILAVLAVIILLPVGLIFLKGIWKLFFAIAYLGVVYGLFGIIGKKVIRWIPIMEVGLLVDKFTGRTKEFRKEGLAITLPTDDIKQESIAVRKIEMTEDYVTQDGSITLDSLVLYTICAEEMRDFLEVQGQLEPAVKSRIQELLQVECGDRTTDEVVSEIGSIMSQLEVELKGSPTEVKLGRLGLHRQKIAGFDVELKTIQAFLGRIEGVKTESAKKKRIESEERLDELTANKLKRLNMALASLEELILIYQDLYKSDLVESDLKKTLQELDKLDLAVKGVAFKELTAKDKELEDKKEFVEKIIADFNSLKGNFEQATPSQKQEKTDERTGLEKDFHINIVGNRLFNPKLEEVAQKARDGKVTAKYKRDAVMTDYQTTKMAMEVLKDRFPDITDKELLEYVMAMRDKKKLSRDEKVFDIPQLKDLGQVIFGFLQKPEKKFEPRKRDDRR